MILKLVSNEKSKSASSVLVYLFLQHAAQNNTRMTSCVQIENIEGLSFTTDIFEGGWISVVCEIR